MAMPIVKAVLACAAVEDIEAQTLHLGDGWRARFVRLCLLVCRSHESLRERRFPRLQVVRVAGSGAWLGWNLLDLPSHEGLLTNLVTHSDQVEWVRSILVDHGELGQV